MAVIQTLGQKCLIPVRSIQSTQTIALMSLSMAHTRERTAANGNQSK